MAKEKKTSPLNSEGKIDNLIDAYSTFIQSLPTSKLDEFKKRADKSANILSSLLGNSISSKNIKSIGTNEDITRLTYNVLQLMNREKKEDPNYNKSDFVEEDLGVVDLLGSNFQNAFLLMDEYEIIKELIPNIGRVIDMIVKDIINIDPLTKRSIYNIYSFTDETDEEKKLINDFIDDVLKEIDFENRSKKWIETSLVSGCNPVAVIPLKSIVDSTIRHFSAKDDGKEVNPIFSLEKYMDDMFKITDKEGFIDGFISLEDNEFDKFTTKPKLLKFDINNYTDVEKRYGTEEINLSRKKDEDLIDKILSEDILSEAKNIISAEMLEMKKNKRSEDEFKKEISELGLESINSNVGKSEVYSQLKNTLKPIVKAIDDKVSFTMPGLSGIVAAKKSIKRLRRLKNEYPEDEFSGYNEDDYTEDILDKIKNLMEKEDSTLSEEIIILDLDSEKTIPVINNKIHIGYFVIEHGDMDNTSVKRNTFGNILQSLGMDNDNAVMGIQDDNNSNISGFNRIFGGINLNVSDKDANNESEKYALIEKIVAKTISSKMSSGLQMNDLYEEKSFKDSIGMLLKKGIIARSNIRYTYIPERNVVYYSNKLNDKGLPVSIMDGTLMFAYLYLSSMMSNYMIKTRKGSGKEVQEIDIGKTKQVGLSIAVVDKLLSTQTLDSSVFTGGAMNVIKTAGTSKKYVIPMVNDQMLYNVKDLEQPEYELDDEWTEKLLNQMMSRMSVPPYVLGELNENEFARSIASRDREYLNNIVTRQGNFSKYNTKLIKLVLRYKLTNPKYKDVLEKFDISKINVNYSMPIGLLIQNLTDSISNVKEMVDVIVESFLKGVEGESTARIEGILSLKLYKTFITTIGIKWEDVQDMVNASFDEVLNGDEKKKMLVNKSYETMKTSIEEREIGGNEDDGY